MAQRVGRIFFVAGIAAGATLARADTLTLRNGTTVDGIIKQIDGGYDVTLDGGKHRFVPSDDVKSVKLNNEGKVTEANVRERLLSLQRSVEAERDIDRVIERYEQFISMNGNTEATKLAQKDLDVWRDRKAKGMLKVGRRWLTPAERDATLLESAKTVDQACTLIAQGKIGDATVLLRKASEEEPDNVSFQYLNGVLQLQREQFYDAKRSFDAVAEQVTDHPPTLVNLAVLSVQFKRWPQAVTLLEQALTLAPQSQEILDDVLELQQIAPESTRKTGPYDRLMKRAAPLEIALQERQAKRGLFRLGSTWVDKAALDRASAELYAYEKKKDDLEKDYQASQEAVRKNDEQIGMLQRMIQRIEADSLVQDTNGNVIRRRYPETYYDLQRDLSRLQEQQKQMNLHIVELRKQAEVVKANEPKPPFAGKLMPIDQRGVPVILPANATTQPSTQAVQQTESPPKEATVPEVTVAPATKPAATMPAHGLFD